jgi:hypothetical protein
MQHFLDARARAGLPSPPLPAIVAFDEASTRQFEEVVGEAVSADVLDLVMQVMPYAFDSAIWATDEATRALAGSGVEFSSIVPLLDAIVDYPIRTSWGASPEPRSPLPDRPTVDP